MATELGMSISTFRRWLKREGIVLPKGALTPSSQRIIYRHYYDPDASSTNTPEEDEK